MNKKSPMTPNEIRAALVEKNIQQSGLARELGVTRSVIGEVITGKTTSYRVQCHIADAIELSVEKVFGIKKPPRKGRPRGRGLFDRQKCA